VVEVDVMHQEDQVILLQLVLLKEIQVEMQLLVDPIQAEVEVELLPQDNLVNQHRHQHQLVEQEVQVLQIVFLVVQLLTQAEEVEELKQELQE
jgi:hypothetical protein